MKIILQKIWAVLEVIVVVFGVVPLLTLGIYRLFPRFESWQTETLGFPFPVFVYLIMMTVSLLIPLLRRKKLAAYGFIFSSLKYHLDIFAACFIPMVLSDMPLGMGLDHRSWGGALTLAILKIGLLFAIAWILRSKPTAAILTPLALIALFLPLQTTGTPAGKAVVLFLTYAFFVGFGEEMLYRGYMQSRLNEVFGKPFTFFGVRYGWGGIITAILFGLTHVGILRWVLGMNLEVTWAWGFWTVFSGLAMGYVREKSGSVFAPALLHGMPQAIATVVMLFS